MIFRFQTTTPHTSHRPSKKNGNPTNFCCRGVWCDLMQNSSVWSVKKLTSVTWITFANLAQVTHTTRLSMGDWREMHCQPTQQSFLNSPSLHSRQYSTPQHLTHQPAYVTFQPGQEPTLSSIQSQCSHQYITSPMLQHNHININTTSYSHPHSTKQPKHVLC